MFACDLEHTKAVRAAQKAQRREIPRLHKPGKASDNHTDLQLPEFDSDENELKEGDSQEVEDF